MRGQRGRGGEGGDDSVVVIFVTSLSCRRVFPRSVRTRGKGAGEEGEDEGVRAGTTASSSSRRRCVAASS